MLLRPCILQYMINFSASRRSSGGRLMLLRPCIYNILLTFLGLGGALETARCCSDRAQSQSLGAFQYTRGTRECLEWWMKGGMALNPWCAIGVRNAWTICDDKHSKINLLKVPVKIRGDFFCSYTRPAPGTRFQVGGHIAPLVTILSSQRTAILAARKQLLSSQRTVIEQPENSY